MVRFSADVLELSDDEHEEAVAEQQRRGATIRQARRPSSEVQSLRGPAPSARKKMRRVPPKPTDRITRQQGPAPEPGPLRPQRQEKKRSDEEYAAYRAHIDAKTANTKRLNKIKKRENRSLWAVTPEERPALREYQRTWPSVGTYICDLFPNVTWSHPASDEHMCSICFECYEPKEVVVRLPCAHVYHRACIQGWLLNKDKCPLCIRPVLTYE
ncbi:hypothetical protein SPRG_06316 [Saprolegnia parasitica CBS 223.65]|uniref:RING-type domain-containing protein n=1 Tax=Saprolegnia parasitica (strain CBS 223.65) TaxID=695850 RepID=A0A067CP21_SAPPC|nr:hypothetical protein SPRG_06316 [Saprolegnia parasitica CBS 223.65]KDO28266.1 hypothetical protein SPRG_06316 [Saprolegnia parasitica CBS 223.65]|eukprot:XP_012201087.1 hypothetical protein SPRG_06316 [Saprolegnia parasitica CBS 223.65]